MLSINATTLESLLAALKQILLRVNSPASTHVAHPAWQQQYIKQDAV
jgi:hypothetical protein